MGCNTLRKPHALMMFDCVVLAQHSLSFRSKQKQLFSRLSVVAVSVTLVVTLSDIGFNSNQNVSLTKMRIFA